MITQMRASLQRRLYREDDDGGDSDGGWGRDWGDGDGELQCGADGGWGMGWKLGDGGGNPRLENE